MIRIEAVWISTAPLDMRAGTNSALARVVAVFGAARPHHADLFANRRANRMKVPFKKLAKTIAELVEAVLRGMIYNRSNAFVEAMNGLLQQATRAARGLRTATNFIAIAHLRMSKLKCLPAHPFAIAALK